jgi:hypothetical protein
VKVLVRFRARQGPTLRYHQKTHSVNKVWDLSCFLLPVGEGPNQSYGHAGIIGGRTIANGYHILDPVIHKKLIDLLVQLRQFLYGLKYLQLSGKGFNFYHFSYLLRAQLMIYFNPTMMPDSPSMRDKPNTTDLSCLTHRPCPRYVP